VKATILVVDDFASIRHFVCEMLEKRGYKTITASNGIDALAVVLDKTKQVDLVLTDYNMPGCNGLELLKAIKSDRGVSQTPVIFLTTELSPEKMREAREAGLDAWIKKPYRADSFFTQLSASLSNSLVGKASRFENV
jgi:CheY-like chemotaxis protein